MRKLSFTIVCFGSLAVIACREEQHRAEVDPIEDAMDAGHATVPDVDSGMGDSGAHSDSDGSMDLPDERDLDRIAADARLEKSVREHFTECGILVASGTPVRFDEIRDEHGRCVGRCLLGSRCYDLWTLACGDGHTCAELCPTPDDGFACSDGTRIPHALRCDLIPDCPDGGDEGAHCGTYTCSDGTTVALRDAACDFVVDCSDGADEAGCAYTCDDPPPTSTCGAWDEDLCDGVPDCEDASDEADCP